MRNETLTIAQNPTDSARTASRVGFAHRLTRGTAFLAIILIATTFYGCGHDAGVVFPPLLDAPRWPAAPEPARLRYVGQLAGSADLKPAVSPLQALGSAVFGPSGGVHAFQNPMAVCTDGGDRVFVADSADHSVHVLNLKTRDYQRWTPAGRKMLTPVGLAYDGNGRRLLVADSTGPALLVFSLDGNCIGELAPGQFKRPCGIAVDERNGRIFVSDVAAHQVLVLSTSGQVIQRLGARGDQLGQFNYPTYVALDAQGRLYVSDSLNFRVQQFSADLTPIRQIGKQGDMPGYFAQPKGIAVDPDGHIYVVDAQFEAVQIFDDTGTLLMDFGEEGRKPGEFWLPVGIFIDGSGRVWVADAYNHRVQVFDYLREQQP
jgi:DNA-binding beta-propeller fold protein YncE